MLAKYSQYSVTSYALPDESLYNYEMEIVSTDRGAGEVVVVDLGREGYPHSRGKGAFSGTGDETVFEDMRDSLQPESAQAFQAADKMNVASLTMVEGEEAMFSSGGLHVP